MFTYDPPGNVDDLGQFDNLAESPRRADFLKYWHQWITDQIRDEIKSLRVREGQAVPLFFTEVDHIADNTGLGVPWNAYP